MIHFACKIMGVCRLEKMWENKQRFAGFSPTCALRLKMRKENALQGPPIIQSRIATT